MPSSIIRNVDYNPKRKWLTVTLQNGRVYRFDGVPPEVLTAFELADSKSEYFLFNIRDEYPHWEIPSEAAKTDFVGHLNS